jgi:hypothetical protein
MTSLKRVLEVLHETIYINKILIVYDGCLQVEYILDNEQYSYTKNAKYLPNHRIYLVHYDQFIEDTNNGFINKDEISVVIVNHPDMIETVYKSFNENNIKVFVIVD